MDDDLTGKCFKLKDQLIRIKHRFDICATNCYICSCLIRLENNLGYRPFPDIIFSIADKSSYQVDPIIYDKIFKLLKINTTVCSSILRLAKKPNRFTGYTKCIFPTDCYKLFHRIGNSEVMTKFSPECAYISIEEPLSLMHERLSLSVEEQILPETYARVRDTLIDTIKQIDDIWLTM